MALSVLFVCMGNSCRSPMAEGILRAMIPEDLRGGIRVASAGTGGFEDMPPTEHAVDVMNEHGIDISSHLSRGLDRPLIDATDLILAMTRSQVDWIHEVAPDARLGTFLLSRFADGSDVDVPDPIGAPREDYEAVYDMMAGMIEKALPRILQMAREEAE